MTHEATRRNYNRLSRWYDLFSSSERHFTEAGLRMLNVQPGEKVLEIGFGTGHSLVELARAAGQTGKVLGIDLSEGMLLVASKRVEEARVGRQVELSLGDATHLPESMEALDAVFMSFTLELFDTADMPLVLAECSRVLHKGGRLGVVSMAKKNIIAVRLYEWAHAHFPNLLDCRPIHAQEVLRIAGFEIGEATMKSVWGLPVEIILARRA